MLLEKPRSTRMTMAERKTLLSLAGGDERAFPILFLLCGLPYKRKGEVFRYMINHGIVGCNLIEVFERNHKSPFKLFKAILDKVDGHMAKPLTARDLL